MSRSLSSTVLRAMSIFGGLQVVQILCSAIRIKLVALWIGPAGVGLFGIYNNAVEMIAQISQLGVRTSAVRDVATATGERLSLIVAVVRRWGVWLGLLGALLTLGCAEPLSELTFGDKNHTLGFVALSVVLFLMSIIMSEQVVMQGLSKLRNLAMSSLWGAIGGLIVSIPLFYWLRIDSIIPSIIAYALITCIACLCYRKHVAKPSVKPTVRQTIEVGSPFIKLGFFMTISVFVEMLFNYIFLSYLNNYAADTDTVGYYQAGYTLFNRYVGLIFTAIAMEFYPRLTRVVNSERRTTVFVNHELGLVLWVLIPVIAVFITLADPMVRLLYSDQFLIIVPFITWGILGQTFRALSWCMAMTILVRGDSKVFIVTESLSAVSGLVFNVVGYHAMGLLGLGIAFILWYVFYAVVIYVVYRRYYHLRLDSAIMRFFAIAVIITTVASATAYWIGWWIPALISLITTILSYRRLKPLLLSR